MTSSKSFTQVPLTAKFKPSSSLDMRYLDYGKHNPLRLPEEHMLSRIKPVPVAVSSPSGPVGRVPPLLILHNNASC